MNCGILNAMIGAAMQKCVFIIDDDPIIRYFLRLLIERKTELKVYDFDNGYAALRLLSKEPILIICDYEMESFNGIQVLEKVLQENPSTNVCMMSSLEDSRIQVQANNLGAEFFPKDDDLNQNIMSKLASVVVHTS